MSPFNPIGAIIAGGQSTRMGETDKLTLQLGDQTLLQWSVARLEKQTPKVVVNLRAQSPAAESVPSNVVVPDKLENFQGPLAGLAAVFDWVNSQADMSEISHIITIAGDTPFFPENLVEAFQNAAESASQDIIIAECEGYTQPLFGCWPISLKDNLAQFLVEEETRKVMAFVRQHSWQRLPFDVTSPHPFFNVNTPDDADEIRRLLREDTPR